MSPFWWGLLIGTLALGGPVGFLTAALCAAAARGDAASERAQAAWRDKQEAA